MSEHDEPFANGLGILLGIVILWVGTLALVFAGKAGYDAFFGEDGGADGQNQSDADLESRSHQRLLGPDLRIG